MLAWSDREGGIFHRKSLHPSHPGDCLRGCGIKTLLFVDLPRVGSPCTDVHHSKMARSVVSLYVTICWRAYCLFPVAALGAIAVPSGTVDSRSSPWFKYFSRSSSTNASASFTIPKYNGCFRSGVYPSCWLSGKISWYLRARVVSLDRLRSSGNSSSIQLESFSMATTSSVQVSG